MPSEIDICEHKRRNNDGGNTARIQTWIRGKIMIRILLLI